jgi:predicted ATPase/transcriptional regulator with XRE-family HTH domain/tetratricopeptide (TPR) repeat protein
MEEVGRSAFGTLLRRFRLEASLSQEALAERARMSVETVRALERGARRAPYRDTVALLAGALSLAAEERAQLEAAAARPSRPRLRGMSAPTQGALALEVVTLEAAEPRQHNLPADVSSLIGRDEAVAVVGALVNGHRLVTLVGSGGVGKTRVALQVARNEVNRWPDGVWMTRLAPLSDSSLVAPTVAGALGVNSSGARPVIEEIVAALSRLRLLLVLDNCEHVVDEAALVAEAILRGCPDVHVLATSRERLNLGGERVYRVPSLAVPPAGEPLTQEEMSQYGAAALFVERAESAGGGLEVGDETAPLVAQICRRLDGIPLAIELAAARAHTLSLGGLARKLDEDFSLPAGGSRTALPRHQTMRATIDWSYELLTDAERALFRRLGVFAGGWTLDVAEAVCAGGQCAEEEVFGLLCGLVEKSLVIADPSGVDTRYRLLESTRAYALEKLDADGERMTLAKRHAEWFTEFFERGGGVLWRSEHVSRAPLLRAEVDNGRTALEWAVGVPSDPVLVGKLTCALFDWDWALYPTGAYRGRFETALARLDGFEHLALQAKLRRRLGNIDVVMGIRDGRRDAEQLRQAISLCKLAGDHIELGLALLDLARLQCCMHQPVEAEESVNEAIAVFRQTGMERTATYAEALCRRGVTLELLGRTDDARSLMLEAILLDKALGAEWAMAEHQMLLAELEFDAGDPQRALVLFEGCRSLFRSCQDSCSEAVATMCQAVCRLAVGEFAESFDAARQALLFFRRWHWLLQLAGVIQHLAALAALLGRVQSAARLRGYVDARFEAMGYEREPMERRSYEILLAALREQLTDDEIAALGAEGALLDDKSAVDEVLAIGSVVSETAGKP